MPFRIIAPTILACLFLFASAVPADAQRPRRQPSPIFTAVDVDQDRSLCAEEIANATRALLTLDGNGDGNLTLDEITPPREERGRGRRGPPPGMMRMDPVVASLDKDGDGELFEDEVTDAAASLAKLDRDGSGSIDSEELRPSFGGFGRRRGGPPGFGGRGRGGDGQYDGVPEPSELLPEDGRADIPDRAAFQALSYQGDEVLIDTHLKGLEYVKFQIENAGAEGQKIYFMNTKTHRAHMMFSSSVGLPRRAANRMRGVIIYWPMLKSPSGGTGLFTFEFEPEDAYHFEFIKIAYDLLGKHSPLMRGHIAYNVLERAKTVYVNETEKYERAKLPVFEVSQRFDDVAYLPLHEGTGLGRLRLMKQGERPSQRDVVLYPQLPNEMPRVAGIITEVRQTPLSHVNLRAIQDDVPNAFIADAAKRKRIAALVGKFVHYTVAEDGFEIREASKEEVEKHFAALRPAEPQSPPRDLSVKKIRGFTEIDFTDAANVGVKAANLATLGRIGLPDGMTPDGFAVPFYFYDEFMKHNGFYGMARKMMADAGFRSSADTRESSLKKFRKAIKKGKLPAWMNDALTKTQKSFRGQSIRCRSSTNNEDLPGFSGAGLYDSFTHRRDEGHLSKSIKQVWASLWNYRAFEERAFYRIDHMTTAMGVVMHVNTEDEQANGVAVSRDILYDSNDQSGPRFYVNAQFGENLVTNPDASSTPEELLIAPRNPRHDRVVRRSSLRGGKVVVSAEHLLELRRALRTIHEHFARSYDVEEGEPFAMEIEFKVTKAGKLFIKQARPWVF